MPGESVHFPDVSSIQPHSATRREGSSRPRPREVVATAARPSGSDGLAHRAMV
ncbi:hypothetical protein WQQ_12930 [Hydrocarboniphaga effusa AP103]|uniref:Uncharacterized protein n=1 Tax=Hydrocarboniphaga effusa AP103 TaxID=1172194 RepID=I8I4J6_9GAMM|nr:hypothetical protein WQQ_12930 [Hydrocarboniphaga effusa AP103]